MNVRTRLFTITPSSAGKTCNRRTDHLSKHSPFIFNLPSTTIIPIPSIGRQLRTTHSPVPRGSSYTNRGLYEFLLSKWFNISWGWASWIISVYLICLADLVAEAHAYQFSSPYYACEDVQNYYAGVQNLRGEALKKKLNIIVSKHQSLPYKKVWDAIMILDAADVDAPGASSEVVEIYSLRAVSKSLAGKPEGWNREHLWPRSYGLLKGPSLTDLHNIRPADVNVNSSRGNKYYGECNADTAYCLKPASKEAAADTETDKKIWAPPSQVRGDIARALMYMAVCYGFPQSNGGVDLQLSDSPRIANKEMGLLSTLLRWNDVDPPSREEKLRNERVCKLYQHNRNPFVDHPEYANLIWKQVLPSRKSSYTCSAKPGLTDSSRTARTGIKTRKTDLTHVD